MYQMRMLKMNMIGRRIEFLLVYGAVRVTSAISGRVRMMGWRMRLVALALLRLAILV